MDEEELKKAERIALKMLVFRDRSEQEVRQKLVREGISASVIEKIVTKLFDYGYLDDQKFAQQLALSLLESKQWGFIKIGATLKARGLSSELVKKTIYKLKENYSEEETARRIMKRRFPHFKPQGASLKEKQRVVQFFQRRGFSWETIYRVLMI